MDTEEVASDGNKEAKRAKTASTKSESKLLEGEEYNEDASICKKTGTKTGKGDEEIDLKSKKVTVKKKGAAKSNK